jgi:hypothetical protein
MQTFTEKEKEELKKMLTESEDECHEKNIFRYVAQYYKEKLEIFWQFMEHFMNPDGFKQILLRTYEIKMNCS